MYQIGPELASPLIVAHDLSRGLLIIYTYRNRFNGLIRSAKPANIVILRI